MMLTETRSSAGRHPAARRVEPREELPRLVIAGGAGRLGSAIVRGARERGYPLAAIIGRPSRPRASARRTDPEGDEVPVLPSTQLALALSSADIYVGASTSAAELANLPVAASHGVPAVIATTGLDAAAQRALDEASRAIPIVADANFSIGAHLLFRVASALGRLPEGFDLSISEVHRAGKRDRPSGTSQVLARALGSSGISGWEEAHGARTAGRVEIASLRAGDVPGQHALWVAGPHELLRVEHWAFGREAFVDGILASCLWLRGGERAERAPGIYSLDDVLRIAPPRGRP